MVTVCWFSFVWYHFDLVKRLKIGVSGTFPEKPLRKWPAILHANVSWQLSKLIRLWWQFVDFSNFVNYFFILWLKQVILGFLGIIWRMCGSKYRGGSRGIFPTFCVEFCLFFFQIKTPNTSIQAGKLLGILELLKPLGLFHMDDLNKKLCWCYVARGG